MTDFSANASTIGFLHQVRYALVLLLENEDASIRLEGFDDLDLTEPGEPTQLVQLKHRAPKTALTDTDADLWKTLRVWSTSISQEEVDPSQAVFSLVTTAVASPESAPAKLRPGEDRDSGAAHDKLLRAARDSKNKALKSAFASFLELDESVRRFLVARSYVLDGSADIRHSRALLEKRLGPAVHRDHRGPLADRLEGWWFGICVNHLRGEVDSISGNELFDKVHELASSFKPEALPIDFFGSVPTENEAASLRKQQFVKQLEALDIDTRRIEKAIVDYYRAFAQRSKWAGDDLLVGGEVIDYEDRLRDEWERMHLHLLDKMGSASEPAMKAMGKSLLGWMEFTANFRIRKDVTEPYVMRGSYHMLADVQPPKVWWHPEFFDRIASVLGRTSQ